MVTFLAKYFIKEDCADKRTAYGTLCSVLGIVLNLLLFAFKFLAGLLSSSIAITADAFNNLSDAGSSLVTLFGFRLASQKPDPDHPFGHGRIEYLSGLAVSLMILLMGFELGKSSLDKILHPAPVDSSPVVVLILCVSIAVKLYMSFYNRAVGKKIGSAAMEATAADSLGDSIATTAVLIATLVAHFTGLMIDGWCGAVVACFIFYAGFNAAKDTIDPLLGTPPSKEFVDSIDAIVMSYPDVLGIHDLIVHDYGPGRCMLSLHAEVDAGGDILVLHDEIDNIERHLQSSLNCHAVIHMDPVVTDDREVFETKQTVVRLVHEIDPSIHLHDFRMVTGPTHINVIFDVVVPFDYALSDEELTHRIQTRVRAMDGNYFAVVTVDKSYV
ncbi:MAG: cation transporter [Oscillibacter sp.]|nr:cation transporter [Oscillibacter sp.]